MRIVSPACLACIAAAYLLRLPGAVQPLGIDQGIFATAAWGMGRDLVLYRDVWDQKPPAIHLAYRAAFLVFGEQPWAVFALDFLASLVLCLLVVVVARRLDGPRAGWLAGAIYAVGTMPALALRYGGFLERAVPETFTPVCVALAVLAVLGRPVRLSRAFAAGLCLGVAALFKPTMLAYGGMLVAWIWWEQPWRETLRAAGAMAAGAVLPAVVAVTWLWLEGALPDAWIAVVEYNRSYVSVGWSWWATPVELARALWLRVRAEPLWTIGAVALLADGVSALRSRRSGAPLLRVLWAASAFVVIAANGARLFSTYFLPVSVPLALAAGAMVHRGLGPSRAGRAVLAAAALAVAVAGARYGTVTERFVSSTAADVAFWRGAMDASTYLGRFGSYAAGRGFSARANAELADYVRQHTADSDEIFIVGMAPVVYFETGRAHAHRFIWTAPVVFGLFDHPDFTMESLVEHLEAARPELLIVEGYTRDSLQNLDGDARLASDPVFGRLLTRYRLEQTVEDFRIYRRQ